MDHPASSLSVWTPTQPLVIEHQVTTFDNVSHLIRLRTCPRGFESDDPDRANEPGYLFLGRYHPINAHSDMEYAQYLMTPPVPRRAWYWKALAEAQDNAQREGNGALLARLLLEERAWLHHDDHMLAHRVWPLIERQPEAQGGHWFWRKTPNGTRPNLNWRGVSNVPVYVILWPRFAFRDVLLEGKRPRKIETCPDSDPYRRCVNPRHFRLAQRLDAPRRLAMVGRGKKTYRASGSVRWTVDKVNADDLLICPNCERVLGEIYQQRYKAGLQGGVAWCMYCADVARQIAEGHARRPRNDGYMPVTIDEEDTFMAEFIRQTGGKSKDWDEYEARQGAQVLPPEPEPIRDWTEQDFQI